MKCCICGYPALQGDLCPHHREMRLTFGPMFEEIGVDFEVSLDRPMSDEGVEEPKKAMAG